VITYWLENRRTLNIIARKSGFAQGAAAMTGYHSVEPHRGWGCQYGRADQRGCGLYRPSQLLAILAGSGRFVPRGHTTGIEPVLFSKRPIRRSRRRRLNG
jgi:hypothetical protein